MRTLCIDMNALWPSMHIKKHSRIKKVAMPRKPCLSHHTGDTLSSKLSTMRMTFVTLHPSQRSEPRAALPSQSDPTTSCRMLPCTHTIPFFASLPGRLDAPRQDSEPLVQYFSNVAPLRFHYWAQHFLPLVSTCLLPRQAFGFPEDSCITPRTSMRAFSFSDTSFSFTNLSSCLQIFENNRHLHRPSTAFSTPPRSIDVSTSSSLPEISTDSSRTSMSRVSGGHTALWSATLKHNRPVSHR